MQSFAGCGLGFTFAEASSGDRRLDSVASFFGWASDGRFRSTTKGLRFAPILTTLLVGGCLAYLPFWLFQGYGHYRFEYTAWNINCLFTEGYAFAFPIVVAPVLAAMTLCRELGIMGMLRSRP